MALGPKWGKNGPKIAKKWDLGSFFPFFWPFFPYFGLRAIFFFFLPIFSPFLDFGPVSILYQAAWLATFEVGREGLQSGRPATGKADRVLGDTLTDAPHWGNLVRRPILGSLVWSFFPEAPAILFLRSDLIFRSDPIFALPCKLENKIGSKNKIGS